MSKNKPKYFAVPTKEISDLLFHPKKDKILVASKAGGLLMYQIGTENRPFCFSAPNFSPVRCLITPDAQHIIGASFEGKIAIWDDHNDKASLVSQAHSSPINDVDMLNRSGLFMTAGNDKTIKLWDPSMKFISSFTRHNSQVTACAFNQVSYSAISGDQSGSVLLWDYRDSAAEPAYDFHFHKTKRYPITSIDIDATGQYFSVLSGRGHLGMFDLRNPEHVVVKPFKALPYMAKMHPTKPYILCAGSTNCEMVFNVEANSLMFSFEGHRAPIKCCAWDNNGKRFATADDDGTVIIWNLPKPPKTPTICFQKDEISFKPDVPPLFSSLPLEVLAEEINILTEHVNEYNEKLADEESRIQRLAQEYRWGV